MRRGDTEIEEGAIPGPAYLASSVNFFRSSRSSQPLEKLSYLWNAARSFSGTQDVRSSYPYRINSAGLIIDSGYLWQARSFMHAAYATDAFQNTSRALAIITKPACFSN